MKYVDFCAYWDFAMRASASNEALANREVIDLQEHAAIMLLHKQGAADLAAREAQGEIIERVDPDHLDLVCWPCTVQDGKLVPKPAPRCNRVVPHQDASVR